MDIADIDDIKELKAMGYDQVAIIQQAQNNLRVIEERIQQLQVQSNGAAPMEALAD